MRRPGIQFGTASIYASLHFLFLAHSLELEGMVHGDVGGIEIDIKRCVRRSGQVDVSMRGAEFAAGRLEKTQTDVSMPGFHARVAVHFMDVNVSVGCFHIDFPGGNTVHGQVAVRRANTDGFCGRVVYIEIAMRCR